MITVAFRLENSRTAINYLVGHFTCKSQKCREGTVVTREMPTLTNSFPAPWNPADVK